MAFWEDLLLQSIALTQMKRSRESSLGNCSFFFMSLFSCLLKEITVPVSGDIHRDLPAFRIKDSLIAAVPGIAVLVFPVEDENGVFDSVLDLPLTCKGNSYTRRCRSDDLSKAGRILFRDVLKIREIDVALIDSENAYR